ncbi:MAG: hypothetical protein M9950_12280 [Thermomicrobiales bacterium]|nr:hypothetical protein [Thermomicrobiales bacterium]
MVQVLGNQPVVHSDTTVRDVEIPADDEVPERGYHRRFQPTSKGLSKK